MTPRFHQSTANTLLTLSPYHAWYFHPDLGGKQKKGTKATNLGNVLDRMLFGVGPELVVIDPAHHVGPKGGIPDGWTNASIKAARDAALAAEKFPVLLDEYEENRLFVEAVNSQLLHDHGIRLTGKSQVEVEWDSPHGVACAGRMDHVIRTPASKVLHPLLILDLKSCRSASEDSVTQSIVKYGYHIQHAAYTEAARVLGWGEPEMKFVFAESTEPFRIRLAPLAGTMKSLGDYQWARACGIWKDCLENNRWPSYPVTRIEAKPWHLAQAVEDGDEAMDIHG